MRSNSIIICDIDGTVCDSSERLRKVGFDPTAPISEWPTDWGDHMEDEPILDMVKVIQDLFENNEIWMVTVRHPIPETKEWLNYNDIFYDRLLELGYPGNTKSPADTKKEWLECLPNATRLRIVCAFEDSPSMIKMFREKDILTFDVGQFSGSM